MKCYIWSIALPCIRNLTLRKVDEKYLKSFEVILEKDRKDQLD